MSPLRGRVVQGVVLSAIALALVACGRKGPPVAPELRVPQPPGDLRANVVAQEIAIDWTNPNRRADGSRMIDLATVRLYRRDESGNHAARPAMRVGGGVHGFAEIAAFDLRSAGRVTRYIDRDVSIGRRYTYVLTAADSQGRLSAPSPRLSVALLAAPRPPTALVGREGETEATLAWDPPRELIDGSPVTGAITYEVLRSTSPDVAPGEVRARGLDTERFTDRRLENEQTYFYAVRAVRTESAGTATSEPTAAVPVTPRDMTAPSPPSELVAVPSPGAVRLAWRASPEEDVAGVIVYRAQGDGVPVRVGRAEVPRTTFTDGGLVPGTYRYFVTSIDRASRPNESRRSAEVTVAVPSAP